MTEAAAQAFAAARPRIVQLAYRMLGQVSEAEDVAQDAWLRWNGADTAAIADPAAWLARTATRLCLDRLRARRAERDAYRGPWLPEPLIEDLAVDPVDRAEQVSVAFLLALERLSPLERAVFLLREVFESEYPDIAETLGRTEAACRRLGARAKAHVREARPRFSVPQAEASRLAMAFMGAAYRGDLESLKALLAEDAVLITDGGGKRKAALRPMVGPAEIFSLLRGLMWRRTSPITGQPRLARINGYLGAVIEAEDGLATYAFQPNGAGRLAAVYVVRNPDKLRHVQR